MKIFKIITAIITSLAGVTAILVFFFQIETHNPSIEIKSITSDKLTDLPTVEGLNAKFYFKDSVVNSLWKLNYIISNLGKEPIIGQGNRKNIITDNLTFKMPENFKILDISFPDSEFPFEKKYSDNKFQITFMQWKPNESFGVTIYTEQLNDNNLPLLVADEYEIINGSVSYTSLQNLNKEKLERRNFFLTSVNLSIALLLFIFLSNFSDEICELLLSKIWYIRNKRNYKMWIIDLKSEEKLLKRNPKPNELPDELWSDYPHPNPLNLGSPFSIVLGGIIFGMGLISLMIAVINCLCLFL